jgi:iron complex outermembrane receptor protein
MLTDIDIAKRSLQNDKTISLAIVKHREPVYKHSSSGVRGLFLILENQKELLKDSAVADRVVGKAAATLLVRGEISQLYTPVISSEAIKILKENKIDFDYDNQVDYILNNSKTGLCPMEKISIPLDNPDDIYNAISSFIKGVMK